MHWLICCFQQKTSKSKASWLCSRKNLRKGKCAKCLLAKVGHTFLCMPYECTFDSYHLYGFFFFPAVVSVSVFIIVILFCFKDWNSKAAALELNRNRENRKKEREQNITHKKDNEKWKSEQSQKEIGLQRNRKARNVGMMFEQQLKQREEQRRTETEARKEILNRSVKVCVQQLNSSLCSSSVLSLLLSSLTHVSSSCFSAFSFLFRAQDCK